MIINDPVLEIVWIVFAIFLIIMGIMSVACAVSAVVSAVIGIIHRRIEPVLLGVLSVASAIAVPSLVNGPAGPTTIAWLACVISAAVAGKIATGRWFVLYGFAIALLFGIIAIVLGLISEFS